MASQKTRDDLGRLLANTLHMWKVGNREDRPNGVLSESDITIEATDTGFKITAFEAKKAPKRTVTKRQVQSDDE
jgi:hypothetical protein